MMICQIRMRKIYVKSAESTCLQRRGFWNLGASLYAPSVQKSTNALLSP